MNNISKKLLTIAGAFVLTLAISISAHAADPIVINNITELRAAIESQSIESAPGISQADGQTWIINAGDYPLDRSSMVNAGGQTGWYFPIVANNLTIQGVGNPVIYGNKYILNGAWPTQDLIGVFGNNVTIKGLTIMPKMTINKTVEVIGADFKMEDVVIAPNSKIGDEFYANEGITLNAEDRKFNDEFSGSIYFNHAGNHLLKNVTINNGGVSFRYSPSGTNIAFDNVNITYKTNDPWINAYRYSTAFNNTGNSTSGDGAPKVTYVVDQTTNNLAAALAGAQNGDAIRFASDITAGTPIVITKALKIDGDGHVFTGNLSVSNVSATITDLTVIDPNVATTGTIDLSTLVPSGTGVLPQMTITSALNTVVLDIPTSTTITAPGWDGILHLPTLVDSSTVTAPAGPNETSTIGIAFSVGSTVPMSFDKGVRLLFPNEAGKRVGYTQGGGTLTEITDVCSADTQAAGDALATDGNCAIAVGSDLVVWTKHFTTFATFSTTATATTSTSATRVIGRGGSGSRASATTPTTSPAITPANAPVGQVLSEQTYVFTINQKVGVRGHTDVKELQKFLNTRNYNAGVEDGIFGAKTHAALKAFQKVSGLTADGIVGPMTRSILNK